MVPTAPENFDEETYSLKMLRRYFSHGTAAFMVGVLLLPNFCAAGPTVRSVALIQLSSIFQPVHPRWLPGLNQLSGLPDGLPGLNERLNQIVRNLFTKSVHGDITQQELCAALAPLSPVLKVLDAAEPHAQENFRNLNSKEWESAWAATQANLRDARSREKFYHEYQAALEHNNSPALQQLRAVAGHLELFYGQPFFLDAIPARQFPAKGLRIRNDGVDSPSHDQASEQLDREIREFLKTPVENFGAFQSLVRWMARNYSNRIHLDGIDADDYESAALARLARKWPRIREKPSGERIKIAAALVKRAMISLARKHGDARVAAFAVDYDQIEHQLSQSLQREPGKRETETAARLAWLERGKQSEVFDKLLSRMREPKPLPISESPGDGEWLDVVGPDTELNPTEDHLMRRQEEEVLSNYVRRARMLLRRTHQALDEAIEFVYFTDEKQGPNEGPVRSKDAIQQNLSRARIALRELLGGHRHEMSAFSARLKSLEEIIRAMENPQSQINREVLIELMSIAVNAEAVPGLSAKELMQIRNLSRLPEDIKIAILGLPAGDASPYSFDDLLHIAIPPPLPRSEANNPLVRELQGKIRLGQIFQRLMGKGRRQADLASRYGIPQGNISKMVSLMQVPEKIRTEIMDLSPDAKSPYLHNELLAMVRSQR